MTQKSLGNMIKYYRATHNIMQKDFATMVGCSLATMSKVESGKQAAKSRLTMSIMGVLFPYIKNDILLMEVNAEQLLSRGTRTKVSRKLNKLDRLKF